MKMMKLVVAALAFSVVPACALDEERSPDEAEVLLESPDADAANALADSLETSAKPVDLYYITTRPDFRKCISPICGGSFVKAVNLSQTKCFGGTVGDDCYVADWDFSALGLTQSEEQKLSYAANNGDVVMRGHYEQYSPYFAVAKLVVSEAWVGVSGDDPKGSFYGVEFNGVVCVTHPCLSYDETLLNRNISAAVAGVDFSHTSATQQQIQAASVVLNSTGLVVAGENVQVSGPAGYAKALRASEFYRQP